MYKNNKTGIKKNTLIHSTMTIKKMFYKHYLLEVRSVNTLSATSATGDRH